MPRVSYSIFFFFNDTATTEIYTLSLHDALPILPYGYRYRCDFCRGEPACTMRCVSSIEDDLFAKRLDPRGRSEEHTSELQSQSNLVCRLLLEKKKTKKNFDQQNLQQPHPLNVRP